MTKKKFDREITDASVYVSGEYLRPRDLADGPRTFGISGIGEEEFDASADEPARRQLVLMLATDPPRKCGLNKTNVQTLIDAWGKNPQRWIGRTFEAHYDGSIRNPKGVRTGGIRVRVPDADVEPASLGEEDLGEDTVQGEKVPF